MMSCKVPAQASRSRCISQRVNRMAGSELQGDGQQQEADCWACCIRVAIPMVGEPRVPAPLFKCGWCGAINDTFAGRAALAELRSKRTRTCFAQLIKVLSSLQWFVVILVMAIISSMILLGVAFVLPNTCLSPLTLVLNHAITFAFTFLILFNYAATVLRSPGKVSECFDLPVEPGQHVPRGAFDNVRYCTQCKGPKPSEAHHCSTCNTCVVDMDHHCPFVSNCVGRANMRNFLSFMGWVVLAMIYCCCHTWMLLKSRKKRIMSDVHMSWRYARPTSDIILWVGMFIYSCPWEVLASMYVFGASIMVFLGVGMLLWSTVSHLATGTSAIGSLKGGCPAHTHTHGTPHAQGAGDGGTGGTGGSTVVVARTGLNAWAWGQVLGAQACFRNVSQIMGGSSVAAWVVPRWGPPPGVLVGTGQKKRA